MQIKNEGSIDCRVNDQSEVAEGAPASSSKKANAANTREEHQQGDSAPPTNHASQNSGCGSTQGTTQGGLEGAADNLGDLMLRLAKDEFDLSQKMNDKDCTPEQMREYEKQHSAIMLKQQMVGSMYSQLQQVISNLLKMYSDVADNAIRNMK